MSIDFDLVKRFHVFDTETVGLSPFKCANDDEVTYGGICELSVRVVDEDAVELHEPFYSLIDPEGPISPTASGVHGIRDKDVAEMPTMSEFLTEVAAEDFWSRDKDPVFLIAHNVKFDEKFVKPYLGCHYVTVDTLRLAKRYFPDSPDHKLQTLRVYLDLPFDVKDSHSANGDTASLLELIRALIVVSGKSLRELCIDAQIVDPLLKMPFGKYRGVPFAQAVKDDRRYFQWLMKQGDVDPEVRKAVALVDPSLG